MLEPGVPRLDCVAGIEGDVGVTVAIAPYIHVDDPNDNIEGRQNSAGSPHNASDSAQVKAGTTQSWLKRAMVRTLVLVVRGVAVASGR